MIFEMVLGLVSHAIPITLSGHTSRSCLQNPDALRSTHVTLRETEFFNALLDKGDSCWRHVKNGCGSLRVKSTDFTLAYKLYLAD